MNLLRHALCVCFALVASCTDVRTELITARGDTAVIGDGDDDGDAAIVDSGADANVPAICGKHTCKCDDGEDNDKDGLIDGLDPECTASYDNDEKTFATGKPKPGMCEDCFWDGNEDASDDGCEYSEMCRSTGAVAGMMMMGPAAMMCRTCEVTERCVDSCRSHTPNGCDCFGCCEITRDDGTLTHLFLGEECSLKDIDDAHKCPSCVPHAQCSNPCGPCELCLGKRLEDLPAECADPDLSSDAPSHQCDEGYQACDESTACADGYYCVLGCCLVAVF